MNSYDIAVETFHLNFKNAANKFFVANNILEKEVPFGILINSLTPEVIQYIVPRTVLKRIPDTSDKSIFNEYVREELAKLEYSPFASIDSIELDISKHGFVKIFCFMKESFNNVMTGYTRLKGWNFYKSSCQEEVKYEVFKNPVEENVKWAIWNVAESLKNWLNASEVTLYNRGSLFLNYKVSNGERIEINDHLFNRINSNFDVSRIYRNSDKIFLEKIDYNEIENLSNQENPNPDDFIVSIYTKGYLEDIISIGQLQNHHAIIDRIVVTDYYERMLASEVSNAYNNVAITKIENRYNDFKFYMPLQTKEIDADILLDALANMDEGLKNGHKVEVYIEDDQTVVKFEGARIDDMIDSFDENFHKLKNKFKLKSYYTNKELLNYIHQRYFTNFNNVRMREGHDTVDVYFDSYGFEHIKFNFTENALSDGFKNISYKTKIERFDNSFTITFYLTDPCWEINQRLLKLKDSGSGDISEFNVPMPKAKTGRSYHLGKTISDLMIEKYDNLQLVKCLDYGGRYVILLSYYPENPKEYILEKLALIHDDIVPNIASLDVVATPTGQMEIDVLFKTGLIESLIPYNDEDFKQIVGLVNSEKEKIDEIKDKYDLSKYAQAIADTIKTKDEKGFVNGRYDGPKIYQPLTEEELVAYKADVSILEKVVETSPEDFITLQEEIVEEPLEDMDLEPSVAEIAGVDELYDDVKKYAEGLPDFEEKVKRHILSDKEFKFNAHKMYVSQYSELFDRVQHMLTEAEEGALYKNGYSIDITGYNPDVVAEIRVALYKKNISNVVSVCGKKGKVKLHLEI